MFDLFLSLAIGAFAGFVATILLDQKGRFGLLGNVLLGMAGGVIGSVLIGFLALAVDLSYTSFYGRFLTSVLGAVVLLWALNRWRKTS